MLAFAGHVDVVPTGDESAWRHPPFAGHVDEHGILWGRGAADMKGAVAAMLVAVVDLVMIRLSPRIPLVLDCC